MPLPGFFQGTEMPDAGWWEALWPSPDDVLRASGLVAGVNAIDLCAGTGWFTLPMAKIAHRVVAIDIDAELLEQARRRLAETKQTNCAIIVADAHDLARIVDKPVEFVFLANAFHGVPDPVRLCASVADVLATGGLFAIVNWHPQPREETQVLGQPRGPRTELRLSPEATRAAVEPSGLKLDRVVEIPPYHYSAIFKKA